MIQASKEQCVAALVTELPNANVHTFSGKLAFPPMESGGNYYDTPLRAENVLRRGAVLRNGQISIEQTTNTRYDLSLSKLSASRPNN